MNKEDRKVILEIFGYLLLIIVGLVVFLEIMQSNATKCVNDGGKAVYTNIGIFEKCVK